MLSVRARTGAPSARGTKTARFLAPAAILLVALAACTSDPPRDAPREAVGVAVAPLMWAEQQMLVAPDADAGAVNFGTAVGVSGDTALVGSGHAAYVFVRSGAAWTLQQELTAADITGNATFGAQVALSGDTALVGGPNDVYVFTRSGTTWTQVQKLTDPGFGSGDFFGNALALDGETALVGAPGAGLAYVFVSSGGPWTLQQVLGEAPAGGGGTGGGGTGGGGTGGGGGGGIVDGGIVGSGDGFGASVALSGDTAIVGVNNAEVEGEAYVFVRSGATWTQQQALSVMSAPVGIGAQGFSVAIGGDTAVVAAHLEVKGLIGAGVFTRSGSTWTTTQGIDPVPPVENFGWSMALGGGTLVVGGNQSPSGGVYVFSPSGTSLAQAQVLAPNDGMGMASDDGFGFAVAIDGNTVVVGAPTAAGGGAAHVFVLASSNGDACTSAGDCASGFCTDGVCCAVASCPAAGPCNAAEHCLPTSGACSVTPLNTGASCATDACHHDGTCQDGACSSTPTLCAPTDACHEFGACDPTSGQCSNPQKPDGVACPGGTCTGGVCPSPGGSTSSGGAGAHGCGCGMTGSPAGGALGALLALLVATRARLRPRRSVPR